MTTEMNEIAKGVIANRLREAIDAKSIPQKEVTQLLGLKSIYYPSMIMSGKPEQWKKVSKEAWERVRDWSNSGETIRTYSNKHGLDKPEPAAIVGEKAEAKQPEQIPAPKEVIKQLNKLAMVVNLNKQKKNDKAFAKWFSNVKKREKQKIKIEVDIIIKVNGKEINLS